MITAKVDHLGVRDCFVHGSGLEGTVVINNTWYASVSPITGGDRKVIGLSRRFAASLGLNHGEMVSVAVHRGSVAPLKRVWVTPLTENDWELLVRDLKKNYYF